MASGMEKELYVFEGFTNRVNALASALLRWEDGFLKPPLTYDAIDDVYHYFRDGVQITPLAGVGQQAGTGSTRLIIGDCCTNAGGGTLGGNGTIVEYEYIRYDNTSAYSPVPEPSVSLLGLVGFGFMLRSRR